jgi:hypothetical protein
LLTKIGIAFVIAGFALLVIALGVPALAYGIGYLFVLYGPYFLIPIGVLFIILGASIDGKNLGLKHSHGKK